MFSLIIPCYNEVENLPLLVEKCIPVSQEDNVEVVLVDNGSTDDTPDVLRRLLSQCPGCRSIRLDKNQGYGFGILSGLEDAKGDILGWTHADLQTNPQDFLRGLQFFDQYGDNIFVKGCRYGRPTSDVIFTIGMSVFETLLLRERLWDINAQPTIFSRKFFQTWLDTPYDFSLDLYAYYRARKEQIPIHRFPVHYGKRAYGVSHWNVDWAAKRKFINRTIRFSLQMKRSFHP
jgi:glycosyltransferase involved in cell wall biosynthesis